MNKRNSKLKSDMNSLEKILQSEAARSFNRKKHLIETNALTVEEIDTIIDTASLLKLQKANNLFPLSLLRTKHIALTFYENSTRTKSSFAIASSNLGANTVNLDINTSSASKGESLEDTARTLTAMGVNAIVQRHSANNSARDLANALADKVAIINAGSGQSAHPTQALLDYFTMLEEKGELTGKRVCILGDTRYSRVARSNVSLLTKMGAQVCLCSPAQLMADDLKSDNITTTKDIREALSGADFVMALRIQLERQDAGIVIDKEEYIKNYQLNYDRLKLASKNVKVLHPGPVVRSLELESALVDDYQYSLIEKQVANGIFVRMAVLALLLSEQCSD